MKKSSIISFFISLLSLFLLNFFWILLSGPERALQYLKETPNALPILGKLNFIQIRDMPGFSGSLGRSDAEEAAKNAIEIEVDAWSRMNFIGYRFIKKSILMSCVSDIHTKKLNFLQRSLDFSRANLIQNSEVQMHFRDEAEIRASVIKCTSLATIAKQWPNKNSNTSSVDEMSEKKISKNEKNLEVSENPKPSTIIDVCKKKLKEHLTKNNGGFTPENEDAVNRNCNLLPTEFLCFAEKAKKSAELDGDNGYSLSMAAQSNIEEECGVR